MTRHDRLPVQDFAVGVVSWNGQYEIINSGPLPEAVAASIAIPFIFSAVDIPGDPSMRVRFTGA